MVFFILLLLFLAVGLIALGGQSTQSSVQKDENRDITIDTDYDH